MRRILLASCLLSSSALGCSKRDAAPQVSPEPMPSAPAIDPLKVYPVEQLTCTDGVLGTVSPASAGSTAPTLAPASASASASAGPSASTLGALAPSSSAGLAPSTSAGLAPSSSAGIASLLAPMDDGGVGFGGVGHYDGGVGFGTGWGFGPGPRRPRSAPIVGVPSVDRDERARMVAVTMCSAGLAVRRCHIAAESPSGDLELALKIEPSGRVAAVDRLGGAITDQAFVSCLRAAIVEKNFTPAAGGVTRYRLSFQTPTEPTLPAVTGALAPEVVRRIMHRHLPRFEHCYETSLKTSPTLAGTVVAEFVIDKTGKVVSVKTSEGTLADEPTRACIARAIMTVEFPEPKGSGIASVRYPLSFRSK